MSDDEGHYLGKVVGYVDHPSRGMRGEPEALDPDQLEAVAEASRRRQQQARQNELDERRAELIRQRDYHEAMARHQRRQLAKLDQRAARGR
jgi:hypothetical protein